MSDKNANTRRRFDAAFIRRVVAGELTGEFADTESPLRIRSTSTGAQFRIQKKVAGRVIKVTAHDDSGRIISDAARVWTLAEARRWAKAVDADLARGRAPARKPVVDGAVTFDEFAEELMKGYEKAARPNSVKARRYGLRDASTVIGSKPVAAIAAPDAVALREKYDGAAVAQRAWIAANWVMAAAVERGLAPANPFARGNVRAPARPAARSRYPDLDEIVRIDAAAAEIGTAPANIVRFAIRLPMRAGAIASLTWGEVDLDAAEIRLMALPGRKFESDQRIPLPALAVAFLRAIRPADPRPDALVFPGRDGGVVKGYAGLYRRLHALSETSGWSIHDLRRSVPSILMERDDPGCTAYDLDRMLGHSVRTSIGGTAAVYQRAEGFRSAKRAADAWDAVLREALRPALAEAA
jgi:integrase